MSKTTKLLLLDSLLQEVCIMSGSHESHVSHNLLYSGLKKAHSKKRNRSAREQDIIGNVLWKYITSPKTLPLGPLAQIQSG